MTTRMSLSSSANGRMATTFPACFVLFLFTFD
jgi:hypothetical protein